MVAEPPIAVGAVQVKLLACLEGCLPDLKAWWIRWGMGYCVTEWVLLANTPARDSLANPLLSLESTPGVWHKMKPLFVVMVHNTRLEAMVSKQKLVESVRASSHFMSALLFTPTLYSHLLLLIN